MTLDEVKLYLRVDESFEDTLIQSLMNTAQEMVEDILRYKLTEFETIPETINQAMLFVVATLFESRQVGSGNSIKMSELIDTVKRLISPYRKKVW